ncbi:RING finger protein [Penicillium cataractarum]|uniref:RING finger protein n=1 Tax=Penicillium cataractarum TaxID=2100454 RepID=A0A9W9R7N2_9EURO|nr:RING finger protein [Penicillium cataractarum]KAJ5355101.1 RING finger protein [Penicillium cataractarum]
MSKVRQPLELSPNSILDWKKYDDWNKLPEHPRQNLYLNRHDFDRLAALEPHFEQLSPEQRSNYLRNATHELRTARTGRRRFTHRKPSTAQPSMALGDDGGPGISSHDKIEAGDILSIAPLAVNNQALHPASTDCAICKYDAEIPNLFMLSNADGSSIVDGSEDDSIRPVYNITPSRHKSHSSYLTPPMRYDTQCPPSPKAQRPVTDLLDISSFNIGSNAGDEVYFTTLTDPLYENKPSRSVVPRTSGPSHFPPSYQPSQNRPLPQYRPLSSNLLPGYRPVFYNPITEFPQARYELPQPPQAPRLRPKQLQYEPIQ